VADAEGEMDAYDSREEDMEFFLKITKQNCKAYVDAVVILLMPNNSREVILDTLLYQIAGTQW